MDGYMNSAELARRLNISVTRAKQIIRKIHADERGYTEKVGNAWVISITRVKELEAERSTYSGAGRPARGSGHARRTGRREGE